MIATGRGCLERGKAGIWERGRVGAGMRDRGRNVKERQRGNAGQRQCLKKVSKKKSFQKKKKVKKYVLKKYPKKKKENRNKKENKKFEKSSLKGLKKKFEKNVCKKSLQKKKIEKKYEKSNRKVFFFFRKSITDSSWKSLKEAEKCFNKKPTGSLLAHPSTIRNSVISWIS